MESVEILTLSWFLREYNAEITFGVALNFAMFIGFGMYKAVNLDFFQVSKLLDRYPVRTDYIKTLFLWLFPFAGTCYVLYQIYVLQTRYLNGGKSVYDYLEFKMSHDYAKEEAENE
ncbi:MAG: hypothetical protein LBU73_05580 [Helicobacteraceae bacterium]|jgi:hypothetical protein|nr:hypothetical protein [Helicobacteraceae bacterium]